MPKLLLTSISWISLTLLTSCAHSEHLAHHPQNHQETSEKQQLVNHGKSPEDHSHHGHKAITITEGQSVPKVDLIVHPDAVKGWNLEVQVENFQFIPAKANQVSTANQGHAHLYINGEKITRLYGNWYYLENLAPGKNEIKVSLNANGHETLVYQSQGIEDLEIIDVKP